MSPSRIFSGKIALEAQTREGAKSELEAHPAFDILPSQVKQDIINTILDDAFGYVPALKVVPKIDPADRQEEKPVLSIPAVHLMENFADELEDIAGHIRSMAKEHQAVAQSLVDGGTDHLKVIKAATGALSIEWGLRYGRVIHDLHHNVTKRLIKLLG